MPTRKHTHRSSQILLPTPLPVFSLVALPCPAAGGGRAPSPLPPPSGRSVISASAGKKKKDAVASFFFLVAGVGFEPHDLRVMSPTSYQTALPRDIMVPETGLEPVRDFRPIGF